MNKKVKGGGKGTSKVIGGASTPIKVIKKGATTPVKPKPKPSDK